MHTLKTHLITLSYNVLGQEVKVTRHPDRVFLCEGL